MIRLPRPFVVGVLAVVALTACRSDPGTAASTPTEGLRVVTALYPLAFVAERVGADDIALTNLAAPGVEPHDLELAPRQVGAIAGANLIIYLHGFSPAVDEAVAQNAADRGLDVAEATTLIAPSQDGDEASDDGAFDPHFWLDPTRLAEVATDVADQLGSLDPDHAVAYRQRAAALLDDLDAIDRDFEAGLATCHTRTIVTAHAAFAYLADRYRLVQLSVASLEPDSEPSASRVADVQQVIESSGVTTVYFEPLASPDVVASIAGDLGIDTAELDPIESASGGEDYLTIMAANLAVLRHGQGCT